VREESGCSLHWSAWLRTDAGEEARDAARRWRPLRGRRWYQPTLTGLAVATQCGRQEPPSTTKRKQYNALSHACIITQSSVSHMAMAGDINATVMAIANRDHHSPAVVPRVDARQVDPDLGRAFWLWRTECTPGTGLSFAQVPNATPISASAMASLRRIELANLFAADWEPERGHPL
jgi:hypothetical protein